MKKFRYGLFGLEPLIYGTGKLGMMVDVLIGSYLFTLITGVLKIKRTA